MSIAFLEQCVTILRNTTTWAVSLISYKHHDDGETFTAQRIDFEDGNEAQTIAASQGDLFLRKAREAQGIFDYNGENTKSQIIRIRLAESPLNGAWELLRTAIRNNDDQRSLENHMFQAYAFVGTYNDSGSDKEIILITKRNPVINLKRKKYIKARNNTLVKSEEPILQFSDTCDFIVKDGIMYCGNFNFESMLNAERTYKKVCESKLEMVAGVDLIDDINAFKEFAMKGHTPKMFFTYDHRVVNALTDKAKAKKVSEDFRIPFNESTGKFNVSDVGTAGVFTKIICGRLKANIAIDGYCEINGYASDYSDI